MESAALQSAEACCMPGRGCSTTGFILEGKVKQAVFGQPRGRWPSVGTPGRCDGP